MVVCRVGWLYVGWGGCMCGGVVVCRLGWLYVGWGDWLKTGQWE